MGKIFLADVMLGRLARWLRALGYDAVYTREPINSKLMVSAYKEGRIMLTRNKKLYKRVGAKGAILIDFDCFREQVQEVISTLGLEYDEGIFFTRCLDCNIPLVPLQRDEARQKVPPFVFYNINTFRACPRCRRIFWSGTHIDEMKKLIDTFWVKKGIKDEDLNR